MIRRGACILTLLAGSLAFFAGQASAAHSVATAAKAKTVTAKVSHSYATPGTYDIVVSVQSHKKAQSVKVYFTGQSTQTVKALPGSPTTINYNVDLTATTTGKGKHKKKIKSILLTARAVSGKPAVKIKMGLKLDTTTGSTPNTGSTTPAATPTPPATPPAPSPIVDPSTGACISSACPFTTPIWGDDFQEDDPSGDAPSVFGGTTGASGTTPLASNWGDDPSNDAGCGSGANGETQSSFVGPSQWSATTPQGAYLLPSGGLDITAHYTGGTTTDGQAQYDSAELDTEGHKAFQYGSIQASITMPYAEGTCDGFWMFGDPTNGPGYSDNSSSVQSANQCQNSKTGTWPTCGESDIVEVPAFVNYDTDAYFDIHGPTTNPAENCQALVPAGNCQQWEVQAPAFSDFAGSTHTYGIVWGPGYIDWTIDGIVYATQTAAGLPAGDTWEFDNGTFHVLLDLAIGGWPGSPQSNANQTMTVNWVHWYQDCAPPINPADSASGCPGT
jgi:beta-glucanase (GH16 family)